MPIQTGYDRNAGFATGQAQVLGFGLDTGIDSKVYGAPGARIFYVDPNNVQATDPGNTGQDPTVPLATMAAALLRVRPYHGDTIVVGANDAWQFSAGLRNTPIVESLVIPATCGGIRIVAANTNPLACTWSPADDNEAAITVYAADVEIDGFAFIPGAFTNCTGVQIEWNGTTAFGDNTTVKNCYFDTNLDYGIAIDYGWYCQVLSNFFDAVAVAAIHNLSVAGDADFCQIVGNRFVNATAAIDLEASDTCTIHANLINGDGTGANNFIDLTGANDCLVSDNWLACTIAQYDVTCSDATSGAWVNNHCINGDTTANPL